MAVMTLGRKCLVLAGRRAGEKVTVVKVLDTNFVECESDKGKKVRRYNIRHLEPV